MYIVSGRGSVNGLYGCNKFTSCINVFGFVICSSNVIEVVGVDGGSGTSDFEDSLSGVVVLVICFFRAVIECSQVITIIVGVGA